MGNTKTKISIGKNRIHSYIPCIKKSIEHLENVDRYYNRTLDTERVQEYKVKQKDIYTKTGHLCPIGVLVVCKFQNKYYSCDGSHRMKVFEELLSEGIEDKDSYLTIEIVDVSTTDEIKEYFRLYNSGVPVPEFTYGSSKDTIELLLSCIKNLWPQRLSKSTAHYPYTLHLDQFGTFLNTYSLASPGWDKQKCISVLSLWNNKLKRKVQKGKSGDKCREYDFYLGMYRGNEEEIAEYLRSS